MNADQTAYWDAAIRSLSQTAEWKKELDRNDCAGNYKASADRRRCMRAEYAELKTFLIALDPAK